MDRAVKAARMADQIRDNMAVWTHQEMPGYIFSISQATLSLDLSEAFVWVEVFDQAKQKEVLQKLNAKRHIFQRKLNAFPGKLALVKIRFRLDDSADLQKRFDDLLKP